MNQKKKITNKERVGGEDDDEDTKLREQLAGTLITEMPNVSWDDIAGLEKAKQTLKEAVILSIQYLQLFQGKCQP